MPRERENIRIVRKRLRRADSVCGLMQGLLRLGVLGEGSDYLA